MGSYSLTLLDCGSLFLQEEKKYRENMITHVCAVFFNRDETPSMPTINHTIKFRKQRTRESNVKKIVAANRFRK